MKDVKQFAATLLVANLVALCLLGLAAYLIHLGRDGWGWCVFAAILCGYGPKTSSKDESTE